MSGRCRHVSWVSLLVAAACVPPSRQDDRTSPFSSAPTVALDGNGRGVRAFGSWPGDERGGAVLVQEWHRDANGKATEGTHVRLEVTDATAPKVEHISPPKVAWLPSGELLVVAAATARAFDAPTLLGWSGALDALPAQRVVLSPDLARRFDADGIGRFEFDVAADASGFAVVAFLDHLHDLAVQIRSPDGSWLPTPIVVERGADAEFTQVSVALRGTPRLLWARRTTAGQTLVETLDFADGTTLAESVQLDAGTFEVADLRVEENSAGSAIAAWSRVGGGADGLALVRFTPAAGFTDFESRPTADPAAPIAIGIDGAGSATIAWSELGELRVERHAGVGGFVEESVPLLAPARDLVVRPDGAVALVALEGESIRHAVRAPDGSWASYGDLPFALEHGASDPAFDFDASGARLFAWTDVAGGSGFDPTPAPACYLLPSIASLSLKSAAPTVGVPVEIVEANVPNVEGEQQPSYPASSYEWDLDDDGLFELATGAIARAHATFATAGHYVVHVRITNAWGMVSTGALGFDVGAGGGGGGGGGTFRLTLRKSGPGDGVVTSEDGGIDFGSDGVEDYPAGTRVYLHAFAFTPSLFSHWEGVDFAENGDGYAEVVIDRDRTVTADFQ
ncbi:MAG: PKD domain-containing protein [Planctomycetes bacterium]|nr:PKD domain-containing protein [Planctomycetota bacterium]